MGTVYHKHVLQAETLVIHVLRDKKLTWRRAAIKIKFVNQVHRIGPFNAKIRPHFALKVDRLVIHRRWILT